MIVGVVVGALAYGLGLATMAFVRHRRPIPGNPGARHEGSTAPEDVTDPGHAEPSTPPEPPGASAEEVDRVATSLADDSAQLQAPIPLEKVEPILHQLGVHSILPEEEEPVDHDRHTVDGTIRTADPLRDGSVADVLSPGLQTTTGRVIRKATVYRYEFETLTNPVPAAPDLPAAAPPDREARSNAQAPPAPAPPDAQAPPDRQVPSANT